MTDYAANGSQLAGQGAAAGELIDPSEVGTYHAHVYYDGQSRATAAWLREQVAARFDVVLGRWRETPVGPHPQAMYQVAFAAGEFQRIVPWLALNRRGLTILVHPDSGHGHADDHLHRSLWLGQTLPLDEAFLRRVDAGAVNRA